MDQTHEKMIYGRIMMNDKQQYFNYLDILRETGITNMFAAPMYLVDEFGLNRYDARQITKEWMEQFEREKSE
jgi:hypothetical protein